MAKAKKSYAINTKAKKYRELLALQKEVNKMIKESALRLGKEHSAYKQAQAKKRQFYKSRGMRTPAQFSAKGIRTSDVDAYKNILESLKESVYLDKNKYEKLMNEQLDRLINKGLAKDRKQAIEVYDTLNENKELLNEMGVPPSEFVQFMNEQLNEYNINEDDFFDIYVMVTKYLHGGDPSAFFDLMEKAIYNRNEIKKLIEMGVSEKDNFDYVNEMSSEHFNELANDYIEYAGNNGDEEFATYAENWLNG